MIYPYLLISLTQSLFLLGRQSLGFLSLAIATGFAFYNESIDLIGLIVVGGIFFASYLYNQKENVRLRISIDIFFFTLSIFLFIHLVPGFNNLRYLKDIQLSSDSAPYSMWLNFDKPLIAIAVLSTMNYSSVETGFYETLKVLLKVLLTSVIVLMAGSFLSGYVRYDFKVPEFTLM